MPPPISNVRLAAVANGITMARTAPRVKVGHKPVVPQAIPMQPVLRFLTAVAPPVASARIKAPTATQAALVPLGLPLVLMAVNMSMAPSVPTGRAALYPHLLTPVVILKATETWYAPVPLTTQA